MRFRRKKRLGFSWSPHLAAGHVVRIDPLDRDASVGTPIPGSTLGGPVDYRSGSEAPIRSAIEIGLHPMSNQGAVLQHSGLHMEYRFVTRIARHELLFVVHDHLNGAPALQRQEIANGLVQSPSLAAKVTADGCGIYPKPLRGYVQCFGEAFFYAVGRLA